MKKKTKTTCKIISIFLVALLVLQILPMELIAKAYTEFMAMKNMPRENVTTLVDDKDFSSKILYEVEEKRDEFTKVYKKKDGSYTAMLSSEPLHFMQDGKWTDIDNTLISSFKDGESIFTNTNNEIDVLFPEVLSEEMGIEIKNNEHSLSFKLQNIDASSVELTENDNVFIDVNNSDIKQQITNDLTTQSDIALYENIMEGTDVEYSISSNKIKENIIINELSSIKESYSFEISAEGLTGVIENDNSVSFNDANGEKVFYIPAPFMKDSTEAVSMDIEIILTDDVNGNYILTYYPDTNWLEDSSRVYPVIIDPVISVVDSSWVEDVSVTFEHPDNNCYTDTATISSNGLYYDNDTGELVNLGGTYETYVKFNFEKLGLLTEGITPIDAQLVFGGAAMNIAAYEITSAFDPTTVTYNTKPQISSNVIDYYTGHTDFDELEIIHFDITKTLYQWLSGESNANGIAILGYDNTVPGTGLFTGVGMFIEYVETSGYDDSFDYHSYNIGRAGTSYINDFTQGLTIIRDDISISGNIMPVSISFIHNSAYTTMVEKFSKLYELEDGRERNIPQVYGNDWITNYNRGIFVNELASESIRTLSYFTGTGSIINFVEEEQEDGSTIFVEEKSDIFGDSGYSLVYDSSTSFNPTNVKIINPNGETEEFDSYGRLVKIYKENYPSQSINIVYESNLTQNTNIYAINYITDGVGRKYDFSYDETTGLLTTIQTYTKDGKAIKAGSNVITNLKTSYEYDANGNTTTIIYPDSDKATYEYNSNNQITSAISLNAYKLVYAYDNSGRVCSISEHSKDVGSLQGWLNGNTITISPNGPKQVTFSDQNGANETKQFDRYGRTTLVTDEKGNYVDSDVGSYRTMSKNLISNQSFENGLLTWMRSISNAPSVSTAYSHSGIRSLKFSSSTSSECYVQKNISVAEAGFYTFSAYIKTTNEFSGNEKIIMYCAALDENENILTENTRTVSAITTDFERYSVFINAPVETDAINIKIGFDGNYGEFYVDSTHLEKGSGFGAYNQLENSSFSDTYNGVVSNWSGPSYYTIDTDVINKHNSNTVNYTASKKVDRSLYQTIELEGKEGDIIGFGGWMKAEVISNNNDRMLAQLHPDNTDFSNDRFAGYTLTYSYITTENDEQVLKTETIKKSAKDFIDDWQFIEEYVILKGDTSEFTISFEYVNYPSAVSIAMPFLTIEQGVDYSEEETVAEEPESEEVYTSCICSDCFIVDCPCECESEEVCDCAECKGCQCSDCTNVNCTCTCENENACNCDSCQKMFDIQYDEFGNLLSIKIAGKDISQYLSAFTARSFTTNGNYMTSSTNENGNTVTYDYNETNGMLDSVTDARGNVTEYSYNAMGALTQVKTPVSGLKKELSGLSTPQAMTTNYSYLNDRVVRINHNDFAYYIDYDQWGNVDKVYTDLTNATVGAVSADYTYGTGVDRSRLEGIRYGNDGSISYTYDEYDRVIGIKYNGSSNYRFEYGYDTLGNITSIIDNDTGRKILYNENTTEVYTGSTLLYCSGYDDNGDFFEYEGTEDFVYTTKKLDSTTDPVTGFTTNNTQISSSTAQVNMLKTTDNFGRTYQKAIQLRSLKDTETNNIASVVTDYTYKTYGIKNDYAAGQVDTIKSYVAYGEDSSTETIVKDYGLSYEYDANGNITHEYKVDSIGTETLRYRYTYDEANQIIRVDDNIQSKTYTYQYDKGGNRVSEKIYAYTLSNTLGSVQDEITSEYGFILWNDRLSKYDGKEITYDNAGNPVTYDGKTYTWSGKQLTQITMADGSKTQYSYDANGIRTRKIQYDANGDLLYYVDYVWEDGKIITQYLTLIAKITIDNQLTATALGPIPSKILYDDNGIPQGFMVGETSFAFVRNLQGDVIAMVDCEGNIVVEYSYDPWGNIEYHLAEGVTEDEAIIFTALCPLTYRGYNYDFTTGLYYLQSRYYNPEWGRFLNCDDTNILLATQGETHNANLFAYCNNNPVNAVDYKGYKTEKLNTGEEIAVNYITALYCIILLEENGYNVSSDVEPYAYEYSESAESIYVCRIAFRKLASFDCIKIMIGTIEAWKEFENIDPLTGDEIDDLLDNSASNLTDYYVDNFGVHSEWREDPSTSLATSLLMGFGYLFNYSMYIPLSITAQNNYKNSYTYQWNQYKSYDGMYAISKKHTYMSKKKVANFISDASIPEYDEIDVFGGLKE